jgi:hypothetical protein
MLLSAWRDGTVRLQDLRSPSPFDVVYQDNVDPWTDIEALLTYGFERFVGGSLAGPMVKVFDFRWTKGYYYTSAAACSSQKPFPRPPQPFAMVPADVTGGRPCCDHRLGFCCRWHYLSRDIYYRPNASFFFSKSLPAQTKHAGVWSLAKASVISPNFYIGITGGVVEASLSAGYPSPGHDGDWARISDETCDPNYGYKAAKPERQLECGYRTSYLPAALMETGDGLSFPRKGESILLPPIRTEGSYPKESLPVGVDLRKRHRLDFKFHEAEDFKDSAAAGRR